ncbi:MAG: toll/interleukin-1 receptor domain-containing protein [Candidatus Nanopelagicales bacterium]|jgi:hypothetical protein|nr:toll/interleukin-1 receptor domain-containing protein [Candidatus Nanopelagicales bacterium]
MPTKANGVVATDVFISYAHDDGLEAATAIVRRLEALGYTCWWDKSADVLPAGARYDEVVLPGIEAAGYFLLLATPAGLSSHEVKGEVTYSAAVLRDRRAWIPFGVPVSKDSTEIHKNMINHAQAVELPEVTPEAAAAAAGDCIMRAFADARKEDRSAASEEIGELLPRLREDPDDRDLWVQVVEAATRGRVAEWGVNPRHWDRERLAAFLRTPQEGVAPYRVLFPERGWADFVVLVLTTDCVLGRDSLNLPQLKELVNPLLTIEERKQFFKRAESAASGPRLRYHYSTVRMLDLEAPLSEAFRAGLIPTLGTSLSPIVGASTTAFAGREQLLLDGSARDVAVSVLTDLKAPADGLDAFVEGVVSGEGADRDTQLLESEDPALTELRGALLALAFVANDLFVAARVGLRTPIKDWPATPVVLSANDASRIGCALARALQSVKQLEEQLGGWEDEGGERLDLLGLPAIHRHLRDWAKRFPCPSASEPRRGRSTGREPLLDQQEVVWLGDLFWHSLTFESPCYPRPDDLEFQVALVHESRADQTGTHRRSLGRQISATRSAAIVAESLALCLERGLRPIANSPQAGLYASVAAALVAQRDRSPAAVPIAVNCAFDLELERAIARTGSKFHVAFPVVIPPTGAWEWVVADFGGTARGVNPESLRVVRPGRVRRFARWGRDKVEGPVVVRLNGAPMLRPFPVALIPEGEGDQVTPPAQAVSQTSEYQVVIPAAFGEFDAMAFLHMDLQSFGAGRDSADSVGWPEWARTEIAEAGRRWISVGMGMEDWNSRMQVFIHATRASIIGARPGGDRAFSVAEGHDDNLTMFLTACSVKPLQGNAMELQELLMSYAKALKGGHGEHER